LKSLPANVSIERLCGLFGKTRQAYYDREQHLDNRRMQDAEVLELVAVARAGKRRFGCRTLMDLLEGEFAKRNIKIGRDRLFELMRDHGLLIKPRRRYVRTTDSNHHYHKWPNLVSKLDVYQSEQVWVSDITYIPTEKGFLYLFLITDAYSRKVMGYHLSHKMEARGAVAALKMAMGAREFPERDLIHHSDRGIQYCSKVYVEHLTRAGISISMTDKASPSQNAIAERINRTFKEQLGMNQGFASYQLAMNHLQEDVRIYNHIRRHTSCSNLPPAQAHVCTEPLIKTWKKYPRKPAKGGGANALHTSS
jgi:transposase InsO family protein